MAEISTGATLYSCNQQLNENEPILLEVELAARQYKIQDWLKDLDYVNYFMLLNNDLRYYTVFSKKDGNYSYAASEIIGCLQDNGKIISIDLTEDYNWECWVRDEENKCHLFYLFPYNSGTIEF